MLLNGENGWTQGRVNMCTEVLGQIVEVLGGDRAPHASNLVTRGDEKPGQSGKCEAITEDSPL